MRKESFDVSSNCRYGFVNKHTTTDPPSLEEQEYSFDVYRWMVVVVQQRVLYANNTKNDTIAKSSW